MYIPGKQVHDCGKFIHFVKPHKISTHSAHSDNCYFHFFTGCLIELKFYGVSRNCFLTQFSVKVLIGVGVEGHTIK